MIKVFTALLHLLRSIMAKKLDLNILTRVKMTIDDEVIERCLSEEWQSDFYHFDKAEDVFEHLAYNLIVHKRKLTMLDGFADLNPDTVKWVISDCDSELEVCTDG